MKKNTLIKSIDNMLKEHKMLIFKNGFACSIKEEETSKARKIYPINIHVNSHFDIVLSYALSSKGQKFAFNEDPKLFTCRVYSVKLANLTWECLYDLTMAMAKDNILISGYVWTCNCDVATFFHMSYQHFETQEKAYKDMNQEFMLYFGKIMDKLPMDIKDNDIAISRNANSIYVDTFQSYLHLNLHFVNAKSDKFKEDLFANFLHI